MPKKFIHPDWYSNAKVYFDGQLIYRRGSFVWLDRDA